MQASSTVSQYFGAEREEGTCGFVRAPLTFITPLTLITFFTGLCISPDTFITLAHTLPSKYPCTFPHTWIRINSGRSQVLVDGVQSMEPVYHYVYSRWWKCSIPVTITAQRMRSRLQANPLCDASITTCMTPKWPVPSIWWEGTTLIDCCVFQK